MSYKHKILGLIFLMFLTSCSSNKDSKFKSGGIDPVMATADTINFNLDEAETLEMSKIFLDITYVPLESKQGKLIGRIEKVIFKGDKIFVLESSTPSVFIYGQQGRFINQIKIPKGKGPGELLSVYDLAVDNSRNEISVLGPLRVNSYSYEGDIINEIHFKMLPNAFGYLPNGDYVLYMDNYFYDGGQYVNPGYNLLFMNEDGEIYNHALPIKKSRAMLGYGVADNFPSFSTKKMFYGSPDHHVYELMSDSINVKYYLDFGKHNIPASLFKNRTDYTDGISFGNKILEEGYAFRLSNFLENDDMIHFYIKTGPMQGAYVFYSKKTGNKLYADSLINDIDYGLTPPFWFKKDNQLVMFVQPSDLITKAEEIENKFSSDKLKQYKKRKQNLIDLTEGMSPMDNPILMFCELKSF